MTLFRCVRTTLKPCCTGQTSFRFQQCRTLYLLTETFSKRPPPGGSRITKLVPFNRFEDPEGCIIDLHLTAQEGPRRMSLLSAMQLNINPGWALCVKETQGYNEYQQYKMKLLISEKLQTHVLQRAGKGSLKSRIFRFSTKTSNHTFVELMATMWYHLSKRQVVEVQVQYHRADYRKMSEGAARDPFEKLFAEYIHLRPDVILKAMPEKCGITVSPQTDDSGVICWVIGPPHIEKDRKLSVPENRTQELYKKREQAINRLKDVEEQALKGNMEGLAGVIGGKFNDIHADTYEEQRLLAIKKALRERQEARKKLEQELKARETARKLKARDMARERRKRKKSE